MILLCVRSCYPETMTQNAMSFFEQRYQEHQRLYTHPKTQALNFMICDILLLAEPHFYLHSIDDGDDMDAPPPVTSGVKLPISRAMTNADTYIELNDSVLDKILNTDCIELRAARILIKRLRKHGDQLYKNIHSQIVSSDEEWTMKLWEMTQADIVNEVLQLSEKDVSEDNGNGIELVEDDIIVEKRTIHHGMKDKNREYDTLYESFRLVTFSLTFFAFTDSC